MIQGVLEDPFGGRRKYFPPPGYEKFDYQQQLAAAWQYLTDTEGYFRQYFGKLPPDLDPFFMVESDLKWLDSVGARQHPQTNGFPWSVKEHWAAYRLMNAPTEVETPEVQTSLKYVVNVFVAKFPLMIVDYVTAEFISWLCPPQKTSRGLQYETITGTTFAILLGMKVASDLDGITQPKSAYKRAEALLDLRDGQIGPSAIFDSSEAALAHHPISCYNDIYRSLWEGRVYLKAQCSGSYCYPLLPVELHRGGCAVKSWGLLV